MVLSASPRPTDREKSNVELYTRIIQSLKIVLPISIVFIIAISIIVPILSEETIPDAEDYSQEAVQNTVVGDDDLVMTDTQFTGLDKNGRLYEITADKIARSSERAGTMSLIAPRAVLFRSEDKSEWSRMTSNEGLYVPDEGELRLWGDVTFFDSDDNRLVTQTLLTQMEDFAVTSNQTVLGFGPVASLRSSGVRIYNGGKTLELRGPARLTIK